MDKTMINPKIATERAARDPKGPAGHRHEKASKARKQPPEDIEVTNLSIDDSDDFGGDPYNHTGSFYAPKFED